jgi:hypothetical protein
MRFVEVVGIALVVVTGGVLAAASVGADEEPIRVVMRTGETRTTFLDFNGNGRLNQGDRVVFRGPLRDPDTGDRAGRTLGECMAMSLVRVDDQRGVWACSYVLGLADGDLILRGWDPAGVGPYVLAVTGGTGSFRNARGQADVRDHNNRTAFTILLEP